MALDIAPYDDQGIVHGIVQAPVLLLVWPIFRMLSFIR